MEKTDIDVYYRCSMCGEVVKDRISVPGYNEADHDATFYSKKYEHRNHVCSPLATSLMVPGLMDSFDRPRGYWQRIGHAIVSEGR